MNREAHQPEQTATNSAVHEPDDGPDDDGGVVVAFPTRQHDAPANETGDDRAGGDTADEKDGEEPWRHQVDRRGGGMDFTAHITYVDGAEGERLRRELAAVTRELLVWSAQRKRARDRDTRRDISRDTSTEVERTREDRAA